MIPISDILIRSISGYVFMVPVFVLYFLWLKKLGRTQSFLHTAAVFVFGYYLFGLLTVTGIGFTSTMTFRPNISWTPFIGMITGPIDTILNIILFVPLGFFLPLLYKKYHHMKTVALTGFLFSLAVEIVQMFGWGSSDINDLMTNTAGACIGFLVYCLLSRILPANLCSATSFLRNWDSILEKKRANLRSISEPARLRQPPPPEARERHTQEGGLKAYGRSDE